MGSIEAPQWRMLQQDEYCRANYEPNAGDRRGYAISVHVYLRSHFQTCTHVTWFLPHSDAHHGTYPINAGMQSLLWDDLLPLVEMQTWGWKAWVCDVICHGKVCKRGTIDWDDAMNLLALVVGLPT